MAATKVDRSAWDFDLGGSAAPADVNALLSIATGNAPALQAAAAAFEILGRPSVRALAKPDVAGRADLLINLAPSGQTFTLEKNQDSFTPTWGNARWQDVPLDGTARIRVALWDMDLEVHDAIPGFVITPDDIRAAIGAGKVWPVKVADQTANQVLFVLIQASPTG